jgi:hypothetical protein
MENSQKLVLSYPNLENFVRTPFLMSSDHGNSIFALVQV